MSIQPVPAVDTAELRGKHVLVTGGTTGIGRATAHALLRAGADVMICGREQSDMDDAIRDAPGPGALSGLVADLARVSEVSRLFAEFDLGLGRLDILINNAAVASGGAEETSLEDIDYVVSTNLIGYLACAHEAVRRIRGNSRGGAIVNVGSMSADVREEGSSIYVATKAGIQGFSEALRKEVDRYGIAVSLIEPGATGTDMQPMGPDEQRQLEAHDEMLTAEDVTGAIIFCLTRPSRADIVELRIRPHRQPI